MNRKRGMCRWGSLAAGCGGLALAFWGLTHASRLPGAVGETLRHNLASGREVTAIFYTELGETPMQVRVGPRGSYQQTYGGQDQRRAETVHRPRQHRSGPSQADDSGLSTGTQHSGDLGQGGVDGAEVPEHVRRQDGIKAGVYEGQGLPDGTNAATGLIAGEHLE